MNLSFVLLVTRETFFPVLFTTSLENHPFCFMGHWILSFSALIWGLERAVAPQYVCEGDTGCGATNETDGLNAQSGVSVRKSRFPAALLLTGDAA